MKKLFILFILLFFAGPAFAGPGMSGGGFPGVTSDGSNGLNIGGSVSVGTTGHTITRATDDLKFTDPNNPAGKTLTELAASGGGSGTLTTIKEDDAGVGGADIVTLDFLGADFDLAETPDTEVQVVIAAAIARDTELIGGSWASPSAAIGTGTPVAITGTTITGSAFVSSAADGARYSTLPNNTDGKEPAAATVVTGFYNFGTAAPKLYVVEGSSKIGHVIADASTDTLTNKTIDAGSNVIKGYGYILLQKPNHFGAGVTQQTTATAVSYGQALFANALDKATNWVEYVCEVPRDIDTSVNPAAWFKFKLGGADTADHEYEISMVSVAASAAYDGTPANAVSLGYTADGTGASGDVEEASLADLTAWESNVTAGNLWIIRVARDGDHATDASTVDSYSGPLTIRYGFSQ